MMCVSRLCAMDGMCAWCSCGVHVVCLVLLDVCDAVYVCVVRTAALPLSMHLVRFAIGIVAFTMNTVRHEHMCCVCVLGARAVCALCVCAVTMCWLPDIFVHIACSCSCSCSYFWRVHSSIVARVLCPRPPPSSPSTTPTHTCNSPTHGHASHVARQTHAQQHRHHRYMPQHQP